MSELPKVFANRIDKDIGNNSKFSYGEKSDTKVSNDRTVIASDLSVHQKIKNIFNSPKYVYKADVVIEMNGEKYIKELIGYNHDYIITLNNEKIAIAKIDDIYFK